NYHLHENLESVELGKRILKNMSQLCQKLSKKYNKKFIISENLSEKAINRFSISDSKNFSKEMRLVSDNNKYTNSVHFREDIIIDLSERVKVQEVFHEFIDEGPIIYISSNELKNSGLNLEEFLTKISRDSKISTLKFTIS
ncbi:MAG: anaerobic ribonucleoside-triphosphate reductase, partial [Candidatus Thorarchaeota archaeon]